VLLHQNRVSKSLKCLVAVAALLTACTGSATAFQGTLFSGTVSDSATGDPLPAAHVRIAGTSRGTITSSAGQYTLRLDPGTYTLVLSMIGYRPDTAFITIPARTTYSAHLQRADIILPEMVVTSEDPAVEIIRRAIASKHMWLGRL
jgi:hypothetical protein